MSSRRLLCDGAFPVNHATGSRNLLLASIIGNWDIQAPTMYHPFSVGVRDLHRTAKIGAECFAPPVSVVYSYASVRLALLTRRWLHIFRMRIPQYQSHSSHPGPFCKARRDLCHLYACEFPKKSSGFQIDLDIRAANSLQILHHARNSKSRTPTRFGPSK